MSSRVCVAFVLATMVAAAAAFPSTQFVRVDQYANDQNCTAGATPTSTSYYPTDYCIVSNSGARGDKYMFDNSMNNVVIWRYANGQCTGTATLNTNYSIGTCAYTSGIALNNRKTSLVASSVGMISTTSFATHGCGSDVQSTSFFMQGCRASQGTSYSVGGKLEICFPTDSNNGGRGQTDCGGDTQCESVSRDCFDQNSDSGADAGSVQYDWNAANAAAPAVALTAALIAFVAAATKF